MILPNQMRAHGTLLVVLVLLFAGCSGYGKSDSSSDSAPRIQDIDEPQYPPRNKKIVVLNKDVIWCTKHRSTSLYKSSNGGETWQEITISSEPFYIYDFFFLNEKEGWVVGGNMGQVWYTLDGGENWTKRSVLKTALEREYYGSHLYFFDRHNGWDVDAFSVSATEDGGLTWRSIFTVNGDFKVKGQPKRLLMFTRENLWLLTTSHVFQTVDGGNSWIEKFNQKGISLQDIVALSDSEFIMINEGSPGNVFRSSDDGKTWEKKEVDKSTSFSSLYFLNEQVGMLTGSEESNELRGSMFGVIYQTEDSGTSWKKQAFKSERYMERMVFIDELNGWVEGEHHIYSTNNGGKDWKEFFSLEN